MALSLDPTTVNTELAENYLKKYNNFEAWPGPAKFWQVIKYPDEKEEHGVDKSYYPKPTTSIRSYAARKLVEKIKEHELIFYQLEYLIRKTDKADFQNSLLLMCQHLQCDDDSWNCGRVDQINIFMNESTPLYALGCAAAAKSSSATLVIVTTQKMAPLCHLFTDLCAQIGWTINLIFVHDISDYYEVIDGDASNIFEDNTACFGCIGVVTESADIDSALDVFINSSATAPWQLQRMYIQESVYDEVKEALAVRCGRRVLPACGDAFVARGKLFVCEALGTDAGADGDAELVPVEAYRTTRELCALLRERPAPALSLWAADSQLAHEVALAAPAALVWINEYASFHGPPASSIPVYERLYTTFPYTYFINDTVLKDLQKRWTHWSKLTVNRRVDMIMNVLQSLSSAPEEYDSVADLQDDILNARDESFVSVDDGKICFCVEQPLVFEDLAHFEITCKKYVADAIIATVNGRAVVYGSSINHSGTKDLLDSLERAGVPVSRWNDIAPIGRIEKSLIIKKIKVIRSNFGTIFAN